MLKALKHFVVRAAEELLITGDISVIYNMYCTCLQIPVVSTGSAAQIYHDSIRLESTGLLHLLNSRFICLETFLQVHNNCGRMSNMTE